MTSPLQITQKLERLPALIARATEEAIEAWKVHRQAEEAYKTEKAKQLLQFKAKQPDIKASILSAQVEKATAEQRLELIIVEARVKKAEARVTELDNEFTATKKIGELVKTELMSIEGRTTDSKKPLF